jgi:hypothetical protein
VYNSLLREGVVYNRTHGQCGTGLILEGVDCNSTDDQCDTGLLSEGVICNSTDSQCDTGLLSEGVVRHGTVPGHLLHVYAVLSYTCALERCELFYLLSGHGKFKIIIICTSCSGAESLLTANKNIDYTDMHCMLPDTPHSCAT